MERKDIPQNLQWKTTDVYPSDEAWETEFKAVEQEYTNYDYSQFQGKLSDKKTLLACLELSDVIARRLEKLYLYAHLRHDEDVRVSKYTSTLAMVSSMFSKIFARLAFVDPELTALPEETLQSFIADPDFAA